MWLLNIHHGPILVFLSRILPILVAAAIAWHTQTKMGRGILDPGPLVALIATCLTMRLVFEQGIFGYKFMALAVMLVTLDVVRGYMRGQLLAWVLVVTVAYNPIPYGLAINTRGWAFPVALNAPYAVLALFAVWIAWDALHKRVQWYLPASMVVIVVFVTPWAPFLYPPTWVWQVLLVGPGLVLAAGPLLAYLRQGPSQRPGIEADTSPLPARNS